MNNELNQLMNEIVDDMEYYKEAWSAFGDNPHTEGRSVAMHIAQLLVKKHFYKYVQECPDGCPGTLNTYEKIEIEM